jgi:hypothetical protein
MGEIIGGYGNNRVKVRFHWYRATPMKKHVNNLEHVFNGLRSNQIEILNSIEAELIVA